MTNCRFTATAANNRTALPGMEFRGALDALARMNSFKSALDVVHALRLAVAAVVAMAAAAPTALQLAGDDMLELFALAVAKAQPNNACSVAAYLHTFFIVDGSCGAEFSEYVYAVTLFRSAVMVIAAATGGQDEQQSSTFSAPSSSSRPSQSLEEMAKGWAKGGAASGAGSKHL